MDWTDERLVGLATGNSDLHAYLPTSQPPPPPLSWTENYHLAQGGTSMTFAYKDISILVMLTGH